MVRVALSVAWLLALATAPSLRAQDAADSMVTYLDRYNGLAAKDVDGRLDLANWCGANGLSSQQLDLLREVLKLQPGHPTAYEQLLTIDRNRKRPVDPQWAEKIQSLLGDSFHLFHGLHFTLLSDLDEQGDAVYADAVEETYQTFFKECGAIGLRPRRRRAGFSA